MAARARWRTYLGYRTLFIVNACLVVFIGLSVAREFVRSASIRREVAELQAQQAHWEEQKVSLQAYQSYLGSEAFLEREAREKFGLQRPGETQVIIGDAPHAAVLGEEVAELRSEGHLSQWLRYFFDPTHLSS